MSPAPKPDAPQHLPANALGVLYSVGAHDAIKAGHFIITEEGSSTHLPVHLELITALQEFTMIGPYHNQPNDDRADRLYRVGPAGGFEEGKHYRIENRFAHTESLYVTIDPVRVNMGVNAIRVVPAGTPYRQHYYHSGECGGVGGGTKLMQALSFELPLPLRPYRHLMYAFRINSVPHTEWELQGPWNAGLKRHENGVRITPGVAGLQDGLYAAESWLVVTLPVTATARVAFLEVDDALHRTADQVIFADKARLPTKLSADLLAEAIASGKVDTLRAVLAHTPASGADYPPLPQDPGRELPAELETKWNYWGSKGQASWDTELFHARRLQLITQISALASHPDAGVRREATGAVARATHFDGLNQAEALAAADVLFAARQDQDAQVRLAALDGLMNLKYDMRRYGLAADTARFASLIPALVAALDDPVDSWRRAYATISLVGLAPEYAAVVPALLSARDNDLLKRALTALPGSSAAVDQALLLASSSADRRTRQRARSALKANKAAIEEARLYLHGGTVNFSRLGLSNQRL